MRSLFGGFPALRQFTVLAPIAAVLVGLTGHMADAQAALTKPTMLGISYEHAVSDGRSTLTFGLGADAKISRDGDSGPQGLGLSPTCRVAAASTGTGLVRCGGERRWRLISLRTGTTRPLPGAGQFDEQAYDVGRILVMGSRWLVALRCDESCDDVALQWHTGAHRSFSVSEWYSPNTVLDSPTLRLPTNEPYVRQTFKAKTSSLKYHRGPFTRDLGVKPLERGRAVIDIQVSGWRVAWQSIRNLGDPRPTFMFLNAKTGRRTSVPFSRLEMPGYRRLRDSVVSLAVTRKRIAVTYALADGTPDDQGSVTGVVAALPWPDEIR